MKIRIFSTRTKTNAKKKIWPIEGRIEDNFFYENEEYIFELETEFNNQNFVLLIDDVELLELRASKTGNTRWLWTSDFIAGAIDFEVYSGLTRLFSKKIILSPSKHKLTYSDFELMLTQILSESSALFALGQTKVSVSSGSNYASPITKLEFLRSNFTHLLKTINLIIENPASSLKSGLEFVKPEDYRGSLDPSRIATAFGIYGALEHKGNFLPKRLPIDRKSDQFDTYEHRCIKHSLTVWITWLRQIGKSIKSSTNLNQKVAEKWAKRAFQLSFRLEEIQLNNFFLNIGEMQEVGVSPTHIFTSLPQYRSFFELQRKLNLGIGKSLGDFLDMPISKTYQLYEIWCFFRIISALKLGGFSIEKVNVKKNGSKLIAASNIFEVQFQGFTLGFQKRYDEYWQSEDGVGTFSRTMIPDISIGFKKSKKDISVAIVLDAKYRVDASLNDAISTAHVYRDAIVSENDGNLERQVVGSYLLTPALPKNFGDEWDLEAIPRRFFHPSFVEKFRFGALSLHPKMNLEQVAQTLRNIVSEHVEI